MDPVNNNRNVLQPALQGLNLAHGEEVVLEGIRIINNTNFNVTVSCERKFHMGEGNVLEIKAETASEVVTFDIHNDDGINELVIEVDEDNDMYIKDPNVEDLN